MADGRSRATWETWDDTDIYEGGTRFDRGASASFAFEAADEFYPGEPISTPPRPHSRARRAVTLLALAGGAWGLIQTYEIWHPWSKAGLELITAEIQRRSAAANSSPAEASSPRPSTEPLEPLSTIRDVAAIPGATPAPPGAEPVILPPPESNGSNTESHTATAEASVEKPAAAAPLPPPQIDPLDPYQKRAAAVGLHPQVSRVLLSSMSDADYRNAKLAISKALAEASDTEKFIWPRQPAAKLAVFQVHFVSGDRSDCRRYIVTVVKNGWTTTAPPMEKCGSPRHRADAVQSPARRRAM